jgi:hypothetical protein
MVLSGHILLPCTYSLLRAVNERANLFYTGEQRAKKIWVMSKVLDQFSASACKQQESCRAGRARKINGFVIRGIVPLKGIAYVCWEVTALFSPVLSALCVSRFKSNVEKNNYKKIG